MDSVLILSGPLLDGHERSLETLRRKAGLQSAHRRMGWLNAKLKLVMGEPMLYAMLERRRTGTPRIREALGRMAGDAGERPSLTGVILADCLARQGIPCQSQPLSRFFDDPARTEALLATAGCVFLSSTFLYDVGELEGLARLLKRPHNRLVVGGALTAIVHEEWEGLPEADIVAVGYGEYLVPALADWIRSGYRELAAPAGGRLIRKRAAKMAEDWRDYARSAGVRTIVCLDSLFTMPRKRLIEFCHRLITDQVGVDWVCYARADDLLEEETYRFLAETGPDFYFATLFTPRAPAIPILRPENRKRYGLKVVSNLYSTPPYWGHDTLDCTEVGDLARELDRRLMENRISLNAGLFHDSLLAYRPALREPLLDFQAEAIRRPWLRFGFSLANRFVDWRLRRDYRKALRTVA